MTKFIFLFTRIMFPAFILISCSSQKEITIIGYAYKKDKITIMNNGRRMLYLIVNDNEDANRLCSFNTKVEVVQSSPNIQLKIRLDSERKNLLDTVISIPINSKEPFVSFLHPTDTISKRSIFLGDLTDSSYIKY